MATASEERLNKLTAAIPGVVYQFQVQRDGNWKFLYISPGVEQLFGVSPEAAHADHNALTECIHEADRVRHRQSIDDSFKTLTPWISEHRIRTRNGDLKWVRGQAQPELQEDGSVIWNGILVDITDRKRIEERLKEREELYEAVTDHGRALIWMSGLDMGCYYFNRPWLEFTGRTLEQEYGDGWAEGVHADDLKRCVDIYVSSFKKRMPFSMIYRLRRHDGEYRWILDEGAPRFDSSGEFAGYVGHCLDVTDGKQAEEKLRIAATAFETQEGMMITDAHSVILRVNRAFTEITGYAADEAVGQTPRILKSGRHGDDFYAAMLEALEREGAWQGEIWNRRKSGEVYPEWLTITAVKDADGVVTHYVATLTDITLRKAAEEEIRGLAFFDPLTRQPNRRLLFERLTQAMAASSRHGHPGALLFIDLDNFKTVNDTFGHNVGDQVLQEAAQRIESCVRKGDTLARLGGDEFVVMLEYLFSDRQMARLQAESVGRKILDALNDPCIIEGHLCTTTPSIGITLYFDHEYTPGEVLNQADQAMYQAKQKGRNNICFFDRGKPPSDVSLSARPGRA